MHRFARGLTRALDILLAAMLAVLVAALVWQVVGRYVFSRAPAWSEELARFLMVWITMLGAGVALRARAHIEVTALPDALPPGPRAVVLALRDLVVLAIAFVIAVYGLDLATLLARQQSPAFEVSMALPYAALPAGAVLIALMVVLARLAPAEAAQRTEI